MLLMTEPVPAPVAPGPGPPPHWSSLQPLGRRANAASEKVVQSTAVKIWRMVSYVEWHADT